MSPLWVSHSLSLLCQPRLLSLHLLPVYNPVMTREITVFVPWNLQMYMQESKILGTREYICAIFQLVVTYGTCRYCLDCYAFQSFQLCSSGCSVCQSFGFCALSVSLCFVVTGGFSLCRVLLRVRMLYYLKQEVIGSLAQNVLDGADSRWAIQTFS